MRASKTPINKKVISRSRGAIQYLNRQRRPAGSRNVLWFRSSGKRWTTVIITALVSSFATLLAESIHNSHGDIYTLVIRGTNNADSAKPHNCCDNQNHRKSLCSPDSGTNPSSSAMIETRYRDAVDYATSPNKYRLDRTSIRSLDTIPHSCRRRSLTSVHVYVIGNSHSRR